MNESAVLLQPAFVLRHNNYRESSLILDVLTRDNGIVSVLAKGVRRKKSSSAGLLMPFAELRLSFQGRSDLKLLTSVERLGQPIPLAGSVLFCAFYISELVAHFLHKHDPYPEVYTLYRQCLQDLCSADKVEQTLRFFELNLLTHVGYGVTLTHDAANGEPVDPGLRYTYQHGTGLVKSGCGEVGGHTLLTLAQEGGLDKPALAEAKLLIRMVLNEHLQGKTLKSRAVLAQVEHFLR